MRSMKILKQVLKKIKSINKKQQDFLVLLIYGLIGIAGKRTFRNLARYLQITEHTIARQMSKAFDFISLNTELVKLSMFQKKNSEQTIIAVQDASFIPKAGDKTHGIDYFWNGCAGKPEKRNQQGRPGLIFILIMSKKSYQSFKNWLSNIWL